MLLTHLEPDSKRRTAKGWKRPVLQSKIEPWQITARIALRGDLRWFRYIVVPATQRTLTSPEMGRCALLRPSRHCTPPPERTRSSLQSPPTNTPERPRASALPPSTSQPYAAMASWLPGARVDRHVASHAGTHEREASRPLPELPSTVGSGVGVPISAVVAGQCDLRLGAGLRRSRAAVG